MGGQKQPIGYNNKPMGNPVTYRGFWGMRSGQALEAIYDFLTWNREDWVNFTKVLDELERKTTRKNKKRVTRRQWRESLYGLTRSKLIEPKLVSGRSLIRLTSRGWKKIIVSQIKQTGVSAVGQWCFVSFDIPEQQRRLRQTFRSLLRECGFTLIQKSLWGSRRDVAELLRKVIVELQIENWVTVIEGTMASRPRRDGWRKRADRTK